MRSLLRIALGIIAAIGGFVDIGDLVFNTQAGAVFGYQLLWVIPIGVVGIATFAEMCGRVAAVTGRPVFDVIRQRLGFATGLLALVASQIVNLATIAAELGGIALVLQLLFDAPYSLFVMVALLGIAAVILLVPFEGIERIFGYGGLLLLVYLVVALHDRPDWGAVGEGFVPHAEGSALYGYFVVGLLAAALMPYEVYFYSSGAVEEGWTERDLRINRLNAFVGYGLGGLLSIALIVVAAQVLAPAGIAPDAIGTVALGPQQSFGETGLLLALLGILFAVGGAAIDAAFSGAYNLAQFLGWEWGRYRGPQEAPRFALTWLAFVIAGAGLALSGIDPIDITEYSVIFSVVVLPLTYIPILLIANDREQMGEQRNGRLANAVGAVYVVILVVVALAAVPLLLITNGSAG